MLGPNTLFCSTTRVRLRDHLEAYGVGVGTNTGRCKGCFTGRGGWIMVELCDVGVTRCDVRRLEMAQLHLDLRLLLCLV